MVKKTYQATLDLTSVEDLFHAPDLSPLSADYRAHSGSAALDYLTDELAANSSFGAAEVSFVLPQSELDRYSHHQVDAAIGRWADARLSEVNQDVSSALWRGVRFLIAGLVVFAVLLALSRILDKSGDGVDATLAAGLEVAAWVSLWFPLDTLIFTHLELRLDRRAVENVASMEFSLKPTPKPE